jgi:peptidoglycan hydrolase-like protein with peptidoglycan-binding domain
MATASLALLLGCAIAVTGASTSHAESEQPASNMFRKKATESNGNLKKNWATQGLTGGKATTTSRIVNDGSVSPFLAPDSGTSMQAVADRYAAIVSAGGWPRVPSGKLQKGSSSKAVAALNKRLYIEGYLRAEATTGEFAEIYTSATESAVRRFQTNHGLAVTGTIDGPTLSQLNVPAEQRLRTIRANIPRIAEYTKDLGGRYVVVNIPAQQIETVNDGRVYSIHNAIVGRPSRPTPVVMTPLTIVRFNPYWNAPPSIVERDILPRMLSSSPSKVMDSMNMKVFDGVGGPEVNPNSINWRRVVVDNYHFRQEPGGSNAMATAKIEFNSPFGIYLHDTPEPHLFNSGERLFSSGCVRVQNVATFINWVLQGQDGIDSGRIAELAESKERLDKTIANAPQLRVAYLTAWPVSGGLAAFRRDIYELDGSGFVLGQPLPVGESQSGKRYVLKPIPRSLDAVDSDEAFGFASLFRTSRNPDKQEVSGRPERSSTAGDSLIQSKSKPAAKTKTAVKSRTLKAGTKPLLRNGNSDKQDVTATFNAGDKESTAKKPTKKTAKKSRTSATKTAAKKVVKKDTAVEAAKKAPANETKLASNAKIKKPVTSASAKKPAASCKAGADGKLPDGCKAPSATKKVVAKPEKTASAAN